MKHKSILYKYIQQLEYKYYDLYVDFYNEYGFFNQKVGKAKETWRYLAKYVL